MSIYITVINGIYFSLRRVNHRSYIVHPALAILLYGVPGGNRLEDVRGPFDVPTNWVNEMNRDFRVKSFKIRFQQRQIYLGYGSDYDWSS